MKGLVRNLRVVSMSDVKSFAVQSRAIGPSDLKPFDTKKLTTMKAKKVSNIGFLVKTVTL